MNSKTPLFEPSLSHSYLYGCEESSSIAVYLNFFDIKGPHIIIVSEEDFDSLEQSFLFFNPEQKIYKLPAVDPWFPSRTLLTERVQWLYQALSSHSQSIFLCSKKSLSQKTLPPDQFQKHCAVLTQNSAFPSLRQLQELGYLSDCPIEEKGFYHQKGGLMDIFSPSHSLPVRLSALGDQIESLHFFNPKTWRNLTSCSSMTLVPAYEACIFSERRKTTIQSLKKIPDLPKNWLKKISQGLFFPEIAVLIHFIYDKPAQALDFFTQTPQIWITQNEENKNISETSNPSSQDFHSNIIKQFYFKELNFPAKKNILTPLIQENSTDNIWPIQTLKKTRSFPEINTLENHFSIIASPSENSIEYIQFQLKKMGLEPCLVTEKERFWSEWKAEQIQNPKKVHLILDSLPQTFKTADSFFIKGDLFLQKTKEPSSKKNQKALSSKLKALHFSEISNGDLVVDKIHGVGCYKGLKNLTFNNTIGEYIELEYKDKNRLYIPVSQLHRLFQFKTQVHTKILDQLGQPYWKKKLSKAQKSIQNLVLDLMKTYSARSSIKRKPFNSSNPELIQFEKQFPFEETPDQMQAIQDIYKDMQADHPMDRLIIGDSGYGKTETAMRAVFKTVESGFQAVLLAPTTILSLQHFENFKKRFLNWPFRIELINRLAPPKKIKLIVKDLLTQKVDILIGSHRLLSSDVQFKNLGLIVIDEEHRFGVKQKEKLKKLKLNADCIYMSATPIPRTLSMSLLKTKDISLIQTPPKNRIAPQVFVMAFESEKIKKAIEREIQRGGQVIFVHNRVKTLDDIYHKLSELLPHINIQKAHGQMKEKELEDNILKFFRHECDLLLCTSIVESGMDFARANTIIVHNAHLLGLSQLYQLKGRVGRRSSVHPYCYFIIPEHLPDDSSAVSRLNFMQTHSHLGSGYAIARYDLEVRGGGEFLGSRQSGHITDIGYDLFLEILNEELQPSLSNSVEPEVKLPWPAYIPDSYIPHDKIRLMYYKYLCSLEDIQKLEDLENELKDAFGSLPLEVKTLFGQVMIQDICQKLKIKELKTLGNHLYLTFQSSEKTKLKLEENFSWMHIYEHLQSLQTKVIPLDSRTQCSTKDIEKSQ